MIDPADADHALAELVTTVPHVRGALLASLEIAAQHLGLSWNP